VKVAFKLILFFVIACALTWFGHLGNHLYPSTYWPVPMFPFGALLAAPITAFLAGGQAGVGAWWKRVWRLRAPFHIYAAAILGPLLICIASVAIGVMLGNEMPPPDKLSVSINLLISVPFIAILGGPLAEEPAFRGYGQHELQKVVTPFAASLWIGLGVMIWHIPVFISGGSHWMNIFALPAVSVVYAWLYQAGGSVWPLVALHTTHNTLIGEYFGEMYDKDGTLLWRTLLVAFYVLWALILVWRLGPSLGRRESALHKEGGLR
jgi:membrane protease YdiL (CAAX protease family)